MEETTKVQEVVLTKDDAEKILRSVIDSFTDIQKDNLYMNLKLGRRLHCGTRASIFSDENGGCLITLATTTKLPTHKLDFQLRTSIDAIAMDIYLEVIQKHTLRYYMATAMMEEEPFKAFILTCLNRTDDAGRSDI